MYSFRRPGQRHCTLRPEGTASVVRAALQHGTAQQGPPAPLVQPARCFATSAPKRSPAPVCPSSVSNCWVSPIPASDAKAIADRLGTCGNDSPWGIGIWPWRSTPSAMPAIAPLPQRAGGMARSPPRPARPRSQGRISTNRCGSSTAKKIRDPGPARRRTLLGDCSQRQQPAAL